jgi:glutamate carboxypeptidase
MTLLRFDSDALAASLAGWVTCESPTHDAAAVNRMQDLAEAFFAGSDCLVERIPGRDGLGDTLRVSAGPANGQKPILVMSHLDTAPSRATCRCVATGTGSMARASTT